MIVITGAAGFIGSCLAKRLNELGENDLILVDQFDHLEKQKNLVDCKYIMLVDREEFLELFLNLAENIKFVLHIGARTDTTEKDTEIFDRLNLNYSKSIARICSDFQIPLIYASSAATYGLGEAGYDDNSHPNELTPLNPYGDSKNEFDKWLLAQVDQPPFWAGLKFFNVYGPNEYHKGRMASVIFQTFHQIKKTNAMRLFRSHRPDFKDGEQSRDFVYIKDLLSVIEFLMNQQPENGLYNLGTGTARTFYDLAKNTFIAMGADPKISYMDTPSDIRDTYQYFTEAKMDKLRAAGYDKSFYSLEQGIEDYVQNYLMLEKHF